MYNHLYFTREKYQVVGIKIVLFKIEIIQYKLFIYAFSTSTLAQQIIVLLQDQGCSKEQRSCFFSFFFGIFLVDYEIHLAFCL